MPHPKGRRGKLFPLPLKGGGEIIKFIRPESKRSTYV